MKTDLNNIKKLAKVLNSMNVSGSFYLSVKTDVDALADELKKNYKVWRYNVQLTNSLSINIYND